MKKSGLRFLVDEKGENCGSHKNKKRTNAQNRGLRRFSFGLSRKRNPNRLNNSLRYLPALP